MFPEIETGLAGGYHLTLLLKILVRGTDTFTGVARNVGPPWGHTPADGLKHHALALPVKVSVLNHTSRSQVRDTNKENEMTSTSKIFVMAVVKAIVRAYAAPGYAAHFRFCQCKKADVEHEIFTDSAGPGELCTNCGTVTQ